MYVFIHIIFFWKNKENVTSHRAWGKSTGNWGRVDSRALPARTLYLTQLPSYEYRDLVLFLLINFGFFFQQSRIKGA